MVSEQGYVIGSQAICHFEGQRLAPYQDTRGIWTIGNGNTSLLDGTPVTEDTLPLTVDECNTLREQTLREKVGPWLDLAVRWQLADHQWGALLSLVWNIGNGAFSQSTVLKYINRGLLDAAAGRFTDWCYSGGKYLPALYRRRQAEAVIWRTADLNSALTNETAGPKQ
jgi:lysozyme